MSKSEKDTEMEQQQEAVQLTLFPGAELLARREQLGWTVEDAADRLKMTSRQIHALEADDFAALPGFAVTRGFVRAYAKAMQMDVEPLVAMLQGESTPENKKKKSSRTARPAISTAYYDSRMPSFGGRSQASRKWLQGVLLVAVLIAALLFGRRMDWLPDLSKLSVIKKETPAKVVSDTKQKQKEATADNAKLAKAKLVQKELPPVKPVAVLSAIDKSTVKQVKAPAKSEFTKNVLVLSGREQSWYEFRRPDGLVLKSGLLQAGARKTFTIDLPMQLTLGNAPAVVATLGGEQLEIKPRKGSKTVKLNLK